MRISIHALLAESDTKAHQEQQAQHISIHALLAESDFGFCALEPIRNNISIHALLAESDVTLVLDIL